MCEQEGELGSCIAGVVSWGVGCATEGIPGFSKHCCFGKTPLENGVVQKKLSIWKMGDLQRKEFFLNSTFFRQRFLLITFEILFGSVSDNLIQFRGVYQCAQVQQLD